MIVQRDLTKYVIEGVNELLDAIVMAVAALDSGTSREADIAIYALQNPKIIECLKYVIEFLERAHIVTNAADAFWLLCEQLGNRRESLDAPLEPYILHTIKRLVDSARAWNAFNAMPHLEEKYKQLSLWGDEVFE